MSFNASDWAKMEKWVFRENPHQTRLTQPISTKRHTHISDRTDQTHVQFHLISLKIVEIIEKIESYLYFLSPCIILYVDQSEFFLSKFQTADRPPKPPDPNNFIQGV